MPLADMPLPLPTHSEGTHAALLALRARAEQRRNLLTKTIENHSAEEVQRLVQELQVHQIELEMQYEELLLAQTEAHEARAQYIDLYDFAPVGYCTLDRLGNIVQLNLCAGQQFGAVRARLVGRRFAMFVAPADRLRYGQFLTQVLVTDNTQSAEFTMRREDGTLFHAQLEGLRAYAFDGPQCRLAVLDVSARREAVTALAASESRFRRLFEDSNDAVVLLQGHHFVDCNEAALRLLDYRRKEDIVGKPAWAHAPELQPNGRRTIDLFRETTVEAVRIGSQRCDAVMLKAGGEAICVEAVLTPIELGGPTPLVHILWRDVTAARAAQNELHESRERLQMALDGSGSGVWVWDVASHELHWDVRAQAIFGQPHNPEPVSFDVLRNAVHPHDAPGVVAAFERALTEHTPFDLEYRIVRPDGQVRYILTPGKVIFDEHSQPERLTGIMRDVTPRREAQNALRREKEFTESLLENTIDGIMALDREQRITAWNAEVGRYFGLEAAQALGRPLFEVLPGLDEKSREAMATALAGEAVSCPSRPFPSRPGHYDAFLVPLLGEGDPLPTGVLVIVRDTTERDRLAENATLERLRRQQEVLAAILNTQETERKRIAEALHNGLGQLLYATKLSLDGPRTTPVSMGDTIKLLDEAIRTARTISFELTPGVLEDFGLRIALEALVKRVAPAGLPVCLHLLGLEQRLPAQVEITVYRVVQELLNNVMKHARATEVHVHVAREPGRLIVSVEDDGRGFNFAEVAAQPLAGIGLSGVRNRITLLGSELSIQSRLGQGTIVSFELLV